MIRTLLLCLFLAGSTLVALAQDKNLLARVAYEEAEKAFEAGDLSTAYDELKKVDEHLGKVTPKSQFLRVQVWNKYAERNDDNLENAIKHCNNYLAMTKSFKLPEEKQIEVIRIKKRLEKEQEAIAQRKIAAEAKKAQALVIIDSLYAAYKFKPNLTEAAFLQYNPNAFKGLKRGEDKDGKEVSYYRKQGFFGEGLITEGPYRVSIKNGIVTSIKFIMKHDKSKTALVSYFDAFIQSLKDALPPDNYYNRFSDYIEIYKSSTSERKIRYQRRTGAEDNYIEVEVN